MAMGQQRRAGRPMNPLPATMEPEVRAFVERLRKIYDATGATFVELQAQLHLDPSTLSRYFGGKVIPDLGFLDALFDALHAKVGYPAAAEMRRATRVLYDAALQVRDPQRLEVFRLRAEVEAANQRADQAEGELFDLQAEIQLSRAREVDLQRDLHQLAAHVSEAFSPDRKSVV